MNTKVTPKILSGFMELLPAEQLAFNKMRDTIRDVYESFGFVPVDTPVLELSHILLAKAGGDTEKQIYRFQKGDNDMCLRFDLTVPLARFVAQHQNDLTFPFRRYHIAKAYRGERPQKGRFREFYQADVDIIGSEKLSVAYDAEIIGIIDTALSKLGLSNFKIHINNRKLLHGFYEFLGLQEQSPDILRIVDKMDKIGAENVTACLKDLALNDTQIQSILDFAAITGTAEAVLQALKNTQIENEAFQTGLNELETVVTAIQALGVPETHFMVDLKITRGLDYYTGTVFETLVDGQSWGSVCSGGRYENLAGHYTDRKLPGVGMSIGLTRLFDVLRDAGFIHIGAKTTADILLLPMGDDALTHTLKTAATLRAAGIKTETAAADGKFKNKMMYANKIGVPFVGVIGSDEAAANTVAVKDMDTGTQETIPVSQVVDYVSDKLNTKPQTPIITMNQ